MSKKMNVTLLKNSNGIRGYSKKRYKLREGMRLVLVFLLSCLVGVLLSPIANFIYNIGG